MLCLLPLKVAQLLEVHKKYGTIILALPLSREDTQSVTARIKNNSKTKLSILKGPMNVQMNFWETSWPHENNQFLAPYIPLL